ncbi:FAD-dependent monooxygenase [Arthrobacter sp. ISL-48]|uniref:FAD-dependent monooxygenase n=1 Tax=Arthrobacter sp. ISL-48 TaxID=2819110 RepID=UPI001BE90E03|nr:FAD-dependent monooxygenase [Arthrobacter sp. ISL-48]MBT2534510.1 FAD-dependent monooxygenase [Arthrobacter sp. ISL-48]
MMIDVLIVGAGASGLTMATDLARRGVRTRVVDAAEAGFPGSRAKGVQPRTLEVFDDLGVLPLLQPRSTLYPPLGVHLGPLRLRRTMIKLHKVTEDVPHPNTLLSPQYATDASLRQRLSELGGAVEYNTRLLSHEQDVDGVTATVEGAFGVDQIHARYLVGADGGGSVVRRGAKIPFEGTTDESDRMIVADVTLNGLSRDRWHIWPRNAGRFMGLCPLPDGKFQLMLKLRPDDPADLAPEAIERMVREFVGGTKIEVAEIHWSSLWRPNIRLAEHYRSARVFLIGDAAHVHPPAGGQGLNTGVQDAYNLGWKLGQVLAGAPKALLDTYEAERQPIAARVLGLSTEVYARMGDSPLAGSKRGDEERQLSLSYRGGPLALGEANSSMAPNAGDRAPDAPITDAAGRAKTLFDAFRGPHFTLVAIGSRAVSTAAEVAWPSQGAGLVRVHLVGQNDAFRRIYGVSGDGLILVRPDGYIAAATDGGDPASLIGRVGAMLPASAS